MRIFGIDPGSEASALASFDTEDTERIVDACYLENKDLARKLPSFVNCFSENLFGIEWVTSYGKTVQIGRTTISTVAWIGHFERILLSAGIHPARILRIPRKSILLYFGGRVTLSEKELRKFLILERGGPAAAVGEKREPGPLWACRGEGGHKWSALAVARTAEAFVGHAPTSAGFQIKALRGIFNLSEVV